MAETTKTIGQLIAETAALEEAKTRTLGQLIVEKNERIKKETTAKKNEEKRILKEKMKVILEEKLREALARKSATPEIRIVFTHSKEELEAMREVMWDNSPTYAPLEQGPEIKHTGTVQCGCAWGGCVAGQEGGTEIYLVDPGAGPAGAKRRREEEEANIVPEKRPK